MADTTARFVIDADDRSRAAFASVDRSIRNMSRGVAQFRSLLAGFGITASTRMFAHWIADATKVADLTKDQRFAVNEASAAWKQFHHELQNVAGTAVAELSPALRDVAEFLRVGFFPSDAEAKFIGTTAAVKGLKQELGGLEAQLRVREGAKDNWLSNLFGIDHEGRIAELQSKIGHLRTSIQQMSDSLKPPTRSTVEALSDIVVGAKHTTVDEMFLRAAPDWRSLFDSDGLDFIKAGNGKSLELPISLQLLPDPNWQQAFEPLKKETLNFAEFAGRGLHDSFVGAFMGIEVNFKDTLKRMAAEMAVSGIFSSLGALFPGGSFFSKFFGGFRAGGGPVSAGKGYIVGERGPEWFMPGTSGSIVPAGGGVVINNNIDARGATQELARQLPAILAQNNQMLLAKLADLTRRGRRPGIA